MVFAGKVPLAVLHEQVEREEQDREGQEEQKAVVCETVNPEKIFEMELITVREAVILEIKLYF